jgi:choline dehydrogenase
MEMKLSGYDYVIVGAGSAGCVLAARLSEDPNVKVLLLEAGSPASSIFVHMPAGIRVLYTSPKHNWQFWTEPQSGLNNRKIYIPRGKVVGGSSAINSMIAIRGNPADYDAWAAQGLPEWGYESLRPYLRKIEGRQRSYVPAQSRQRLFWSYPLVLRHLATSNLESLH